MGRYKLQIGDIVTYRPTLMFLSTSNQKAVVTRLPQNRRYQIRLLNSNKTINVLSFSLVPCEGMICKEFCNSVYGDVRAKLLGKIAGSFICEDKKACCLERMEKVPLDDYENM